MADQLAPASGTLQDRYTIERELGRGGMATVYLAEDLKLHRRVALKVLHPDLGTALGPERFLREIRIASRLTHPHILPLHDSGEADGRLYYAMPFVEGESLRQRLSREPQLPVDEALSIVQAVASALDHAHAQGVIHRDIKPENILLVRGPGAGFPPALVADFGIARALDMAAGDRLTETGLALGTPTYMSPEQASAGGRIDGRSDVYSLGCVAYEMLAGAPPFMGPTAQAIMARHAVDPVPPLRTVRPSVPDSVASAIEQALAKVPADRFASAAEFAAALLGERRPWNPSRRRARSQRAGILAASTSALALAGIGALALRGPNSPAVLASASSIAVLPLRAADGDTALTRLGRDLAVTVSASLDGVGGITTPDRLRVAREAAGSRIESPEDAAGLARRLGARSALLGTTVGDGEMVRLDLGLYDAADHRALARGITVRGHRDSLAALSDSVTWAILRQIWARGDAPTPSLSAVTTRSLPALRAFLEGERAVETDDWRAASLAYRSAIAADSTFTLAYFGYWIAQYWSGAEIDLHLPDSSYRYRLPQRERLLLAGWSIDDSLALELERYREVTRRYPDYWPGWFLLGDRLHHVGILLGYDWKDAQSALNKAVALNPKLLPAWGHLFMNSLGKDSAESGRALAHLSDSGIDRLFQGIALNGGIIGPELNALADSIAKRRAEDPGNSPFRPSELVFRGFPVAQVDFDRRVLRIGTTDRARASHFRGSAWAWAQRGAWDSALAAMHQAVMLEPNPPADGGPTPLTEYGMAVLAVWLGQLPSSEATVRRPAAGAMLTALANEESKKDFSGQLAWLDGVLAFSRGDSLALRAARQEVRRSGYAYSHIIDLSLSAFARALRGDRPGAGRELASLEWRCVNRWDCGGPVTPNMAIHRLAAATWLLEAGDTAQATRLLTWHEGQIGQWDGSFTYAVSALAYLMRARIEETRGDTRAAIDHYRQFLRRYDSPMPAQRHLVVDARASLARLEGHIDPVLDR